MSGLAPPPDLAAAPFSERNFARLADLIQSYSGIKMPPGKRTMLATRLRPRLAALGLPHLDAYCSHCFDQNGLQDELEHLINAVTTNKTDFFREPGHFDFLRERLLPDAVQAGRTQLTFWSAAASIGAEAYTIAMVMEAFRSAQRGPDYQILATDISTEVLQVGISGQYPAEMVAPVPAALRARYVLEPRDPARGLVRIAPALRAKIAWARLNLMDTHYPAGENMDAIFCRNILIYFDRPTQARVLRQLCAHLAPGGYLLLGHSESCAGLDLPLITVRNSIFQRA